MDLYEINVQEPYYSYIVNGQKTVEGRLNKGKFSRMQVGDHLLINNESKFKVERKTNYDSFLEMVLGPGLGF